jgi:DNA-binding transcriptional regulator GbsR (MarR family)
VVPKLAPQEDTSPSINRVSELNDSTWGTEQNHGNEFETAHKDNKASVPMNNTLYDWASAAKRWNSLHKDDEDTKSTEDPNRSLEQQEFIDQVVSKLDSLALERADQEDILTYIDDAYGSLTDYTPSS